MSKSIFSYHGLIYHTKTHIVMQFYHFSGLGSEGVFRVNGNMKTVDRLKTAFEKSKSVRSKFLCD